jgi:hypothetical protein
VVLFLLAIGFLLLSECLGIIHSSGVPPALPLLLEIANLVILDQACLSSNWFMCLEDAKEKLERWRNDYNEYRPHSALTTLPPAEFARNHAAYGPESTWVFIFKLDPFL